MELPINRTFYLKQGHVFLLLFSFLSIPLHAQINNRNFNNSGTYSGSALSIKEIRPEENKLEYHVYLFEDWDKVKLFMPDGDSVTLDEARFDILNQRLELKQKGILFVLNLGDLSRFVLTHKGMGMNFVHPAEQDGSMDFAEEIYSHGKYAVYRYYIIHIKPPDYNPALNVGSRSETRSMKQEYYLLTPQKKILLAGSRKKLLRQLKNEKLKDFVKRNKLTPTDLTDMRSLVDYASTI